jgi:hypothetical protein
VAGFTVTHGKIVEIDLLADPTRLRSSTSPRSTAECQAGRAGVA